MNALNTLWREKNLLYSHLNSNIYWNIHVPNIKGIVNHV